MNFVLHIENLAPNGTAYQSTTYYNASGGQNMTADLAINGGPTDTFVGCSMTLHNPFQSSAWWMLTFPVDTVYITNVKIYYRDSSKFS